MNRKKLQFEGNPTNQMKAHVIILYITLATNLLKKSILFTSHYASKSEAYIWYHFHNIAS
jgi:hypothetical protein